MRILEYFFPDRELNLHSLRSIAKEVTEGTLRPAIPQQNQTPPMQDQASIEEEFSPEEPEPVEESVNDLHEPLGCLMKDSLGKFRKFPPQEAGSDN
jgi:aldehyde dehydrogenase (NAD+)